MWEYVIAISIVILIVGVYILSYYLNSKTKKPENCEDIECNSCKDPSCSHRK